MIHRHALARARRAYHAACEHHRGDPTIEATMAVRAAFEALESAKGVRHV